MRSALVVSCLAVALTAAVGCGQSSDNADGGASRACVPGASVSCSGPGQCAGIQVCNQAGSGYGVCSCGQPAGLESGAPDAQSGASDATVGDTQADGDAAVADASYDAPAPWDGGPISATVTGAVQKGPFAQGTTITVQELDGSLSPTGTVFLTSTTDDLGSFTLDVSLTSPYIEVIASGFYFDEISGQLSAAQLTLHAVAAVTASTTIYVNLLTDLAVGRITALVTGGQTFASAVSQAESEILAALSMPATSTDFTDMNIAQAGDANADLLAVSVLLDQDAWKIAPTSPVAELSTLQAQIGSQLTATGNLQNWSPLFQLRCEMPEVVNVTSITTSLSTYYAQQADGEAVTLPDFAPLLVAPAWCEGTSCGFLGDAGSGQTWCSNACASGQATPCCADEQTDPNNCGSCGNACPNGVPCIGGNCGVCVPFQGSGSVSSVSNQPPPIVGPDTQRCSGTGFETCGLDGQWGTVWPCATGACSNGACTGSTTTAPSCAGGGPGMNTCPGGTGAESCCTSLEVPGGTFGPDWDGITSWDGYGGYSMSIIYNFVTVSGFRLDAYEVTVGRFRQFVSAWDGGWTPAQGAGKHTHVNGGQGLVNVDSGGGYETGWDATDWNSLINVGWNSNLSGGTWTATAGSNAAETLPISEVDWYEAYAFCIWDGGFLPSEAEWNYAAAGGSDQRVYPWSPAYPPGSAAITCTDASCGGALPAAVGSLPAGNGKWGQSDLAGNVSEWNLDWYNRNYVAWCTDCANLTVASSRVLRGGSVGYNVVDLTASSRLAELPTSRYGSYGFRCARAP